MKRNLASHTPAARWSRLDPQHWSKSTAYGALALSMMLVGAYVALSKELLIVFPPFALAWIRFLIAAVFMAPWMLTWRGKVAQVPKHDCWVLFGMSFFGNFLFTLCMLYGVAHTSATAAGIIMSLLPAVIALISAWILREHLSQASILTIILAVLGVMSLSLNKNDSGQSFLGNLMMVGALLCEAFYVVGAKYLSKGYSPKQVAVAMNTFGLILTTPLAMTQLSQVDWLHISWATWALMIFYAVSASQIAPWLWFNGLKWIPANRAGVMTVALPLTAALIGVVWFHEIWTMYHTIAFACALAGIVLMAFSKSNEQKPTIEK